MSLIQVFIDIETIPTQSTVVLAALAEAAIKEKRAMRGGIKVFNQRRMT